MIKTVCESGLQLTPVQEGVAGAAGQGAPLGRQSARAGGD